MTNFFVFHGCDGAGIMPDCVGDIKYVERIGPISGDQNNLLCEDGFTVKEIPNAPYNPRRRCEFRHPGLGKVYSDYAAGSEWDTYRANERIPEYKFKSAQLFVVLESRDVTTPIKCSTPRTLKM